MARQTVELPSITFQSKTVATAFFRRMLNRYRDGEELTQDDDAILFELLQRHPDAEKIGVGVKLFYRDKTPDYPTSCFHIERIDGSTTDFSYPTCISATSSTLAQQFYEACRNAVSENLTRQKNTLFKEAGGKMRCSKTGDIITIDEADYRHTTPKFREIVSDFITENNITISPEMVTSSADMQYATRFVDLKIKDLFVRYHTARANLAMFRKHER
ncbi:MAG: DCL family protein [Geobacter sp.]|nr:DCL family protein [Geobacter sp.]